MTTGARRWAVLAALLLVAAAVVAGPRVEVEGDPPAPELPDTPTEVEAWIEASEARVPDLRPDARKEILWATPDAPGRTPLAVVYLHGFSASRQETAPLADSVAASLGANLFYTRLTGHGRDGPAMAEASVDAWLADAEEAMAVGAALGEEIVLMGTSTGGTLALWAAARSRFRDRLHAVVLLSPNLGPADPRARVLLWPWGGLVARLVEGPTRSFEPVNAAQARAWTTSYPTSALLPMMGLVDLADRELLARVEAPTLVLHSPGDRILDVEAIRRGTEALGAGVRRRVPVTGVDDPDRHVLAGRILSPSTTGTVTGQIVEFVRGPASAGSGAGPSGDQGERPGREG